MTTKTKPTAASARKRARALALRSVTKSSAPVSSVVMTVRPQAAREKDRKMPTKIAKREQAVSQRLAERPRQRAADQHDEREDQERPEHVRVLEPAGRAAELDEELAGQPEIAEHAERGRHQRGGDPGADDGV